MISCACAAMLFSVSINQRRGLEDLMVLGRDASKLVKTGERFVTLHSKSWRRSLGLGMHSIISSFESLPKQCSYKVSDQVMNKHSNTGR